MSGCIRSCWGVMQFHSSGTVCEHELHTTPEGLSTLVEERRCVCWIELRESRRVNIRVTKQNWDTPSHQVGADHALWAWTITVPHVKKGPKTNSKPPKIQPLHTKVYTSILRKQLSNPNASILLLSELRARAAVIFLIFLIIRPVRKPLIIEAIIGSICQPRAQQRADDRGEHTEDADERDDDVRASREPPAATVVRREPRDDKAHALVGRDFGGWGRRGRYLLLREEEE